MSEKRYTFTEYHGRETKVVGAVLGNGEEMGHDDAARLLNQQAETIEVLREWLRKCGQKLLADEREIIEHLEFSSPEDVIESKRRIAALEGE